MQLPLAAFQRHFQPFPTGFALAGYGQQHSFANFQGAAHRHRDADGGAVGAVHPRVIGDGEGEVQAGIERGLDNAAVEGLFQAVGGDEAEALHLPGVDQRSGVVPPVHDKVGGFWHLGPG